MRRVYASLPLTGPAARHGRDLLRGAQLALEARAGEAVLVTLDGFSNDREGRAVANASGRRRIRRRSPTSATSTLLR